MSSQGETSPKPGGRTAGVAEHPELGSADDAAVLGMPLFVGHPADYSLTFDHSPAWLQARVASQLYHDRGVRDRIQHHGAVAVYCFNPFILDSCRSCGTCLGQSLTGYVGHRWIRDLLRSGMVSCVWLYLYCGTCNGRFGICHANVWRFVLVDTFLCITSDTKST